MPKIVHDYLFEYQQYTLRERLNLNNYKYQKLVTFSLNASTIMKKSSHCSENFFPYRDIFSYYDEIYNNTL